MDYWRDTNWYAIHTKPCREVVAAMKIKRLGVEVFLPQVKQQKRVWGVTQMVIKPLFAGYLFARFSPAAYLHLIHYARGVQRVVGSGNSPLPVDDRIILAIRLRISEEGYVRIKPQPMQRGDRVVVQEGPLQGLSGIFEQALDDRERAVILLEAIAYQARVLTEKRSLKAQAEAV
jgi:transcriptional antiterminator RfaH